MIAKASGRPGHGRRRTRGDAKKQSGRRRAIRSVFARSCAQRWDALRPPSALPRRSLRQRTPPSAPNARPVARRKEEKRPPVRPQDVEKPADGQGVGEAHTHGNLPAAKFVARAFCRALIVKNGRHQRLASRARAPATEFDDPEGPGGSAGGKPTCIHGRFHGRKWPQDAGLLTPEAKFASDFSLSEQFLRSRVLSALCGRHQRLTSRACDPATEFDDSEGPGGSAGGEQNLHSRALPWTQVAAGSKIASDFFCIRAIFVFMGLSAL